MRRKFAAVICAAVVVGLGTGAALAGEVKGPPGTPNPTNPIPGTSGRTAAPEHANSACAFSGLNDNYVAGNPLPDEDGFTHTQNWGQVSKDGKRFLTSIGVSPGKACNPNTPPHSADSHSSVLIQDRTSGLFGGTPSSSEIAGAAITGIISSS